MISNDILSSTIRILVPDAVDNLHRTTPILSELERLGGIETVDGGQKYDQPVALAEHSAISQMATGYEPVSLSVADALRTASFEWCDFVAPIVITRKEELSNKGPRAIVKIAEARMKNVLGLLKREAAKQMIAGSSTSLTELQTLNGLDAGSGWLEEVAFGSQVNTVGGIAKSGFPTAWQNQTDTASSAFATNGLRAMSRINIQCQTYAPEGDINLVLASPTSYELYKDQLQTQERYMAATETRLDGGKLALAYNGASMFIEPNLGFLGSGAANRMSMYFINSMLMKLIYDKDAKFEMSDFEHVSGFNSRSAQLQVRLQLVVSHLAGLGCLINAEA